MFNCIIIIICSSQNFSFTLVKEAFSNVEVILGQLAIANWEEEVFDYLPNLMYIGGFDGNSALTQDALDSVAIVDNDPASSISNVSLMQVYLPKLVKIFGLDIFIVNNPNLCYIGDMEYYKASPDQKVLYASTDDLAITGRQPYDECSKLKQFSDGRAWIQCSMW